LAIAKLTWSARQELTKLTGVDSHLIEKFCAFSAAFRTLTKEYVSAAVERSINSLDRRWLLRISIRAANEVRKRISNFNMMFLKPVLDSAFAFPGMRLLSVRFDALLAPPSAAVPAITKAGAIRPRRTEGQPPSI
jgi:hypothetical protein